MRLLCVVLVSCMAVGGCTNYRTEVHIITSEPQEYEAAVITSSHHPASHTGPEPTSQASAASPHQASKTQERLSKPLNSSTSHSISPSPEQKQSQNKINASPSQASVPFDSSSLQPSKPNTNTSSPSPYLSPTNPNSSSSLASGTLINIFTSPLQGLRSTFRHENNINNASKIDVPQPSGAPPVHVSHFLTPEHNELRLNSTQRQITEDKINQRNVNQTEFNQRVFYQIPKPPLSNQTTTNRKPGLDQTTTKVPVINQAAKYHVPEFTKFHPVQQTPINQTTNQKPGFTQTTTKVPAINQTAKYHVPEFTKVNQVQQTPILNQTTTNQFPATNQTFHRFPGSNQTSFEYVPGSQPRIIQHASTNRTRAAQVPRVHQSAIISQTPSTVESNNETLFLQSDQIEQIGIINETGQESIQKVGEICVISPSQEPSTQPTLNGQTTPQLQPSLTQHTSSLSQPPLQPSPNFTHRSTCPSVNILIPTPEPTSDLRAHSSNLTKPISNLSQPPLQPSSSLTHRSTRPSVNILIPPHQPTSSLVEHSSNITQPTSTLKQPPLQPSPNLTHRSTRPTVNILITPHQPTSNLGEHSSNLTELSSNQAQPTSTLTQPTLQPPNHTHRSTRPSLNILLPTPEPTSNLTETTTNLTQPPMQPTSNLTQPTPRGFRRRRREPPSNPPETTAPGLKNETETEFEGPFTLAMMRELFKNLTKETNGTTRTDGAHRSLGHERNATEKRQRRRRRRKLKPIGINKTLTVQELPRNKTITVKDFPKKAIEECPCAGKLIKRISCERKTCSRNRGLTWMLFIHALFILVIYIFLLIYVFYKFSQKRKEHLELQRKALRCTCNGRYTN